MHGIDPFQHTMPVQVRLQKNLFDAIESWRRKQEIIPTRPEAIRELIRKSLADGDSAARRGERVSEANHAA